MSVRRAVYLILVLSAAAIGLLFWIIYGVETGDESGSWSFLPALNAFFNAVSATALLTGLYHIRRGNKRAHGASMCAALAASALFLAGYILHHTLHGDTRFLTQGWLRPTYFFILISHILLSIAVLPMVLTTVFLAVARKWPSHRALARWTWPIWLYVSVTGVLVFVFLRFLNS
jgi:putative membrane protein